MANQDHLDILKQGIDEWNRWRSQNKNIRPNLSRMNVVGKNLSGINLSYSDLARADLSRANLSFADLYHADLSGANLLRSNLSAANLSATTLTCATLCGANFSDANLSNAYIAKADFSGAKLYNANLSKTLLIGSNLSFTRLSGTNISSVKLKNADFTCSILNFTIFAFIDLSQTKGLETCEHIGPSIIDHYTLSKSGDIPLEFLRGVGLPEIYIENLSLLRGDPIQYQSCFISYAKQNLLMKNTMIPVDSVTEPWLGLADTVKYRSSEYSSVNVIPIALKSLFLLIMSCFKSAVIFFSIRL